jgi:hypothetical protein
MHSGKERPMSKQFGKHNRLWKPSWTVNVHTNRVKTLRNPSGIKITEL